MKIYDKIPSLPFKIALSVGMFDGVHLGHQFLLKHLSTYPLKGILTFKNHPSHYFYPDKPLTLLMSLEEKIETLKQFDLDVLILLDFTKELAETSYEMFLRNLAPICSTLIQVEGDAFGKNREGTALHVPSRARELGIAIKYLPKFSFEGEIVSSSRIRALLEQGEKEKADSLLKKSLIF